MTLYDAYNDIKKQLKKAEIEDYVFEAKQIIKFVTGFNNTEVLTNYMTQLSSEELNDISLIMTRRLENYPLQYILGFWDFYGRRFSVGEGVLIPRQDTETVIEECLLSLKNTENPEVLDLCTGTGCIGITLAKECKSSSVYMLEKYKEAYAYAEKNIKDNEAFNAKLYLGDVKTGDLSDRKYDLIVSNPPYITKEEMKAVQKELTFEPLNALEAKDGGLEFYKVITKNYKNSLKSGGKLVFEIGAMQGEAVSDILKNEGFRDVKIKKDYSENDRVVFGTAD